MIFSIMDLNVGLGTILVWSFAIFGSGFNIPELVYGSLFILAGMVIVSIIMVYRLRVKKPSGGGFQP